MQCGGDYSGPSAGVNLVLDETALPLASIEITCTKDVLDRGHIDISEDGESWRTVSTFTTAGNVNTLTLSGDKALKMRLCIDKSGWVKISEVNIQSKKT